MENVRKHQLEREREAKKYTPIDLFRTPKLRKWTVIMCYQWYEYNNNDFLTKVNTVHVFRITFPTLKVVGPWYQEPVTTRASKIGWVWERD